MLSNDIIIDATIRSLGLGLTVALLSGILGCVFSWLLSRTDIPGGRYLRSLLSVPYAIPCYLLGMAWIVLGNPTVGFFKDFLPAQGSYGFWGVALVETSVAFTFVYLEMKAGFDRLDPALEEASRMSGATPLETFFRVSFPLLWPSMVNGMALSFLYMFSSFGVPALLGLPVKQHTLTTLIYSQFKLGGMNGLKSGLMLSAFLLAIAFVILFLSRQLLKIQKAREAALSGAKSSRPSLVNLGAFGAPLSGAIWIFFVVTVVLPWLALGFSALAPVSGNYDPADWTLKNLHYVFSLSEFHEALINSALLSVAVATTVVMIGFILGYFSVRKKSRRASFLIGLTSYPFATPGSVIAILLIFVSVWFSRTLDSVGLSFDSIIFWIALAYGMKYSAIGARMMQTAYRQVHPALEEAARISGAELVPLLQKIWFPLLKKTFFAAWLLSFLPMLTELTMSVLLTGPGAATLGTVLFQLQEYADQPSAAALAWMLLTVAILVSFLTRERSSSHE